MSILFWNWFNKQKGEFQPMSSTNVLFIWEVRDELKEYLRVGLKDMKDLNLMNLLRNH